MSMIPWLAPALISVTFYGVAIFLPKLALQRLPPLYLIVWHNIFLFLSALVMLAFYGFRLEFEPRGVLAALALGAMGTGGMLSYYMALQRGPVTPVLVITSLYPIVSSALAALFLHETLALRQSGGVALGICAILLASGGGKQTSLAEDKPAEESWALLALLALALWGGWGFLSKLALQTMQPYSTTFYESAGNFLVSGPVFASLRFRLEKDARGVGISALGAALTTVGILTGLYALQRGSVAVVITMTAMYPLVSVALARVFLHEKISALQGLSLALAVAAVTLLSG